eukprot:COSAG05_NODE_5157_length_1250_cov_1.315378_1_plen_145_part_10
MTFSVRFFSEYRPRLMQALSRNLATVRGGGGGGSGRAAAQDDLHDLLPPSASAATPGTLAQYQQAEEPIMSAGTDTPQAAAHLRSYAAAGSDDIANAKPKLRNISGVWKVAGKTAAGRAVTEHVRLDHAQPGEQLTGGHVLYPGG